MDILGVPLKRFTRAWGAGDVGRYRIHEAVGFYLDAINDETKTRAEVKEACDNAIRTAIELINLQTDVINLSEILRLCEDPDQ